MKKITQIFVFGLFLLTTSFAIIIPKFNKDFLKGLTNSVDKIIAEVQSDDFIYAEQWNDKFRAIKDRIETDFGFIPENAYTNVYFNAGDFIQTSEINAKFQSYVDSLVQIDPTLVIPAILQSSNYFQPNTEIDSTIVNQKFVALNNLIDTTSSLPDKVVVSGETWQISGGTIHEYTNIDIQAGGTVEIVGSGFVVLRARRDFTLNGVIDGAAESSSTGFSITYESATYDDTKAQQSAGTSSGQPNGANGSHGNPVLIYAKNLQGSGSINLSGANGGTGSPATSNRVCNSGFRIVNISSNCGSTRYTCLSNSWNIGNSCNTSGNVCLPDSGNCSTFGIAYNNIKNNLLNMNSYAGGGPIGGFGGVCIASNCTGVLQTPTLVALNNRGGGGAGGNGGNLIYKVENNTSSISTNLSGGSGGALSTYGTGGTVGSNGLDGIFSNIPF